MAGTGRGITNSIVSGAGDIDSPTRLTRRVEVTLIIPISLKSERAPRERGLIFRKGKDVRRHVWVDLTK
jgi:hypothetical protein